MNFAERAFRYLFRKKGKAIILFWVLLITETMILSTVTILRASEVARIELLGKSKAKLLIEREKAEELFTDDEYKKLEKLENVKAVNRVAEVQLYPMDFKIITKSESVDADNQKLRIMAYDSLEDDGPFADGQIHLTKGKYPRKEGEIVLQLSGGQQQRVAIARALASPAKVLLADEPTGNLDEEIADEIIKILMKSAHEMGKSVIVVTHSKKIADAADVVLKIHEGKLYHLV